APHLAGSPTPHSAIQMAVRWLQGVPTPSFERRQIFIDVSYNARSDDQSGVSRVVKEIVRAMYCSHLNGIEPVAVELVDGNLHTANAWIQAQRLCPRTEIESSNGDSTVEFRHGDILLMLDSSWARYREFFPVFDRARRSCVKVYTVVYDLLP